MSRLPIPGQDSGTWGDILNDYLSQSLKPDGTLQDNSVTSNAVAPNSITNAQIASDAVNAASIADGSITNSLIADGTIQEVKLSSTVQTKLNQTAPVTSVNTKTGAVTLDKADIGLGNVDDTSDATKNAATATLTNKTLTNPLVNKILDTNGNNAMLFNATASAVNYAFFVNGAAGNSVSMRADGSDTNIPFALFSKGSGQVQLRSDTNGFILDGDSVASGVNYVGLTNAATGTGPTITSTGSDTNVDLNITAKGTGNLNIPTGTGLSQFNTSDKTTNYERVRHYWSGNTYTIITENGGTGTLRGITLNGAASFVNLMSTGVVIGRGTTTNVNIVTNSATMTSSTAVQSMLNVAPTINQTGTAGYTMLLINPTESTTGSGAKNLIDAQVGGTSKFKISNTGTVTATMAGADGMYITNTLTDTASGSANGFRYIATINPASASSTQFRSLSMSATVPTSNSQTISYTYGGWFESRWQGSGSATTLIGVRAGVFLPAAAQNFGTISNAIGLEAMGVSEFATTAITSGTITYAKGINVAANAKTSAGLAVTNAIGIDVQSQTIGSSLNVGLRVYKSDSYSIQLVDTGGTAAGGITFGTDTNLYRSAADTLKTDDAIIAAGKITTSGNAINVATAKTPSSASDTGTTGDIAWDNNYVYVCVATNTWKRSAISTW